MKKGMTLIEILVASTVLVIGITGLLWSFVECTKINRRFTHVYNATTVANLVFERISRADNINAAMDNFVWPYTNGKYDVFERGLGEGNRQPYFVDFIVESKLAPTNAEVLYLVTARVSWDNTFVAGGSENSIYMSLIPFDPTIGNL